MQLYSEKRSIMNKLIGLLTCLCFFGFVYIVDK